MIDFSGSSPNIGSPHSQGYATLGRPSSLPVSKTSYQRSSSNPDLAGSTPTSPDMEFSNFSGGFIIVGELVYDHSFPV